MKKIQVTEDKKLEYFSNIPILSKEKDTILFIANSYGILTYMKEVITEIDKQNSNYNLISFNFRGQGKSEGKLNLDNAKEDLFDIINYLSSKSNISKRKFYIYVSCSGLMGLLEIYNNLPPKLIDKIIIYNYLATPKRLLRAAKIKMARYDVKFKENLISEDYDVFKALERCKNVPIHIIHPQICSNILRANNEELNLVSKTYSNISIEKPIYGYDIIEKTQSSIINLSITNHVMPQLI